MNWFTKLFETKDWRLCGKLDSKYVVTYTDRYTGKEREGKRKDNCVLTYFLYENQFGERKFDLVDSEEGDLKVSSVPSDHYAYRNEDYRIKIRTWLYGRYDPDISN